MVPRLDYELIEALREDIILTQKELFYFKNLYTKSLIHGYPDQNVVGETILILRKRLKDEREELSKRVAALPSNPQQP